MIADTSWIQCKLFCPGIIRAHLHTSKNLWHVTMRETEFIITPSERQLHT